MCWWRVIGWMCDKWRRPIADDSVLIHNNIIVDRCYNWRRFDSVWCINAANAKGLPAVRSQIRARVVLAQHPWVEHTEVGNLFEIWIACFEACAFAECRFCRHTMATFTELIAPCRNRIMGYITQHNIQCITLWPWLCLRYIRCLTIKMKLKLRIDMSDDRIWQMLHSWNHFHSNEMFIQLWVGRILAFAGQLVLTGIDRWELFVLEMINVYAHLAVLWVHGWTCDAFDVVHCLKKC